MPYPDFKPSILTRSLAAVAPGWGVKRMAAERVLHHYRYEGAEISHKRGNAPQNMSPNAFDVQRDRLQLMREGEDLERNFAPALALNRRYALYVTPISYHAQTGDHVLDREVEEYLLTEVFPTCEQTGQYNFWQAAAFAVMGTNRGGDYGFAFTRPGSEIGMKPEEAAAFDLKIQGVEADRIGGVYQNVVSNDYVAGINVGKYGEILSFRVFHRSMTTNCYDNPIDVPAADFVFHKDNMRGDMYRGISKLATAVQNLRDLYEAMDFSKGKMKIASALTVFTNSNGAQIGNNALDVYNTNIGTNGAQQAQQDIAFGQINHLAGGTDIKFPQSNSPSSEEQWLCVQLLKFVAMAYNLPYSFALDASALGGVSSRLESELAKAEFDRGKSVHEPQFTRIKNTFLIEACARGRFPADRLSQIMRGRWGYRAHPQPDIGREATAATNLYQNGLLDPMEHWVDGGSDPEAVADNMIRWAKIKRDKCAEAGFEVTDVFGSGPAKPLSATESTTESTTTDGQPKQYGTATGRTLHLYRESDESINSRIKAKQAEYDELKARWESFKADYDAATSEGESGKFRARRATDACNAIRLEQKKVGDELAELQERRWRRDNKRPKDEPTPKGGKTPQGNTRTNDDRWERRAIYLAMIDAGMPDAEAWAAAYSIQDAGQYSESKVPSHIKEKVADEINESIPWDGMSGREREIAAAKKKANQ